MAHNVTVVIIDPDKTSAEAMEREIKAIDRHVAVAAVANSIRKGYELVSTIRPMVVLLNVDTDRKEAMELIDKTLHSYPGTCVFATSEDSSSENILQVMRAGCTEFLLRPVTQADLVNAFQKFGRIVIQHHAQAGPENGKVITVFSPKGGMGTSTVATNLAVALHQYTTKPVVLIDLDLEAGDASMFLNVKTRYTISDVTSNIARLDRAFLEGVLARHPSGIYFLAEPDKVEDAETVTAAQVREVLALLKGMFAYIVIDTGIGYDEINLSAFDLADTILMVGVLSLPAIRNLQKALDVFERLGYSREKVKLIINRHMKKAEITVEDAQRTLNYEAFWRIPNDYNEVMASINKGQPLSIQAPNSEISRSFKDLAEAAVKQLGGPQSRRGMSTFAAS